MNKILIGAIGASVVVVAACGGGSGSTGSSATPARTATVTRGTITGFGSVVINGVHFDTSRAAISVDGATGKAQDDLSVGQRVTIRGTVDDNGNHFATEVEYEAELHGLIESIDPVAGSFVALGQTIVVDTATLFNGVTDLSGLAVGNPVEVSGSRQADGSILASYVELEAARAEAELKGPVAALDATAKTFTIGTQVIDFSAATITPASLVLANGTEVEVHGSLNGTVLVATRIKQEHDFGGNGGGDDKGLGAELEGPVRNLAADGSSFTVDSTLVTVNASTTYRDGTAATLAEGVKVEVKGVIQADGSLLASRVEFKAGGHQSGHGGSGSNSGSNGGGSNSGSGSGGSSDDNGGGSVASGGQLDGAISAIDSVAQTITVLGVKIAVADTTVYRDKRDGVRTFGFASLAVGDMIEVAVSEGAAGLTATRLERQKSNARSEVRGALDSFDGVNETLVIAGVAVDASAATYQINDARVSATDFYAALSVGNKVKAKGSDNGSGLTATEVELDRD